MEVSWLGLVNSLPFKGRAGVGMGYRKRRDDRFNHRFRFLKNLIIPEAENAKTGRLKRQCSSLIVRQGYRVLPTIQFDDELCFERDEIQYVVVKRVLSAKFDTELLSAKMPPEQTFGIGCVLAELLWNSVFS
jgi:hypothetical protein